MIEIISATRHDQKFFWEQTPLGISLKRLSFDVHLKPQITFNNSLPIGEIYNRRIMAESPFDILVFIHDDVWIDDYFFSRRVIQGLETYDVIGVAGNTRRVPYQAAWVTSSVNDKIVLDVEHISGAVAHGEKPFGGVSFFGAVPASCELLDGVLLASKRSTLTKVGVLFDPQFKFHYYDLDFCRTARHKGLTLGTWPIAITHQSAGNFGTVEWETAYFLYIQKWKD